MSFFLFFHCTSSIENISKFGFTADRINSTIQKERKKKVVCQIVWLLWQKANFQPKPTKSTRSETYSYTDTVAVWFYSLLVKICYCCCWFFLFVGFRTPAVIYNFTSLCRLIVHQNPDSLLKHKEKYVNVSLFGFLCVHLFSSLFFPFFSLYLVYSSFISICCCDLNVHRIRLSSFLQAVANRFHSFGSFSFSVWLVFRWIRAALSSSFAFGSDMHSLLYC